MSFNLSQIINKFVPTKRVDDDLRENPFNSNEGQEVVSESENFWARKLRYGRTAFKIWDGTNLTTIGSTTVLPNFNPRVDKIFIPSTLIVSADTDAILKVYYIPYATYDPYDTGYGMEYIVNTVISAKNPFTLNFQGQLEIQGGPIDGGNITISLTPLTATGKVYACIHGIEVSKRA